MDEKIITEADVLIKTAKELSDRIDNPQSIPDTCYRGDVSRWNFSYFISKANSLAERVKDNSLTAALADIYGANSHELKIYNRAKKLCLDYKSVYGLEDLYE